MIELRRVVRFAINPGGTGAPHEPDTANGFAGRPSMQGLGRYYELEVHCLGDVDPTTGYFVPISQIDRAVRSSAIPFIARACATHPDTNPAQLMPEIISRISASSDFIVKAVRWRLTPYYSVEMQSSDTTAVLIRQVFDFAAAHRLHVPAMTAQQNIALFGKCNNPNYHGHNYRLEPEVAVTLASGQTPFTLQQLEVIVARHILEHFDHHNLNLDLDEFNSDAGVNPSVENIAKLCYDLLAQPIADESHGSATLRRVTVWETDRTSSTYPA